jgi:hypothetical protein
MCVTGTGRRPIHYLCFNGRGAQRPDPLPWYVLMGGWPDLLLGSDLTGARSDPTVNNGCYRDPTASGFAGNVALAVSPLSMHELYIYI